MAIVLYGALVVGLPRGAPGCDDSAMKSGLLAAAWPGIAVFLTHAALGEIFGHEPYVDPVMHVSGGTAAAYFFARVPSLLPRQLGTPTRATTYLLSFGLTAAVAIVWELIEFLSDHFFATHSQLSVGNTMRDLFNGLVGATLFVAGDLFARRGSSRGGRA